MTREEKQLVLNELTETIGNASSFYITDASTLDVASINKFRGLCYSKNVKFQVVKNTLLKKALEVNEGNYEELYEVLSGPTSLMFSDVANLPAKVLKEFRETFDKPILKAAFIDTEVYLGDDKIKELATLKSKEDLLADVIMLLQSPMKNVVSSLQSSGSTLASLLQTLSEKE